MLTFPPDYTFLIQLGTFFVLMVVLTRQLFLPFLALLEEREQRTAGDVASAAASRTEAEALSARVDADLAAARASTMAEVDAVRRETRDEVLRIVEKAQAEAATHLADLRLTVRRSTESARDALRGEAQGLAAKMVTAVLGREGKA